MDLCIQIFLECIGMTRLPQDSPTRAAYNNQSGQSNTRWRTVCLFHNCLDLETARFSATASTLEFATLGGSIWFLVLVGTHAKVLTGFPRVPLPAEQHGVGTSWGTKSELVEGKRFSTGLQDTLLGTLGKAKGSNRQFGNLQQARTPTSFSWLSSTAFSHAAQTQNLTRLSFTAFSYRRLTVLLSLSLVS